MGAISQFAFALVSPIFVSKRYVASCGFWFSLSRCRRSRRPFARSRACPSDVPTRARPLPIGEAPQARRERDACRSWFESWVTLAFDQDGSVSGVIVKFPVFGERPVDRLKVLPTGDESTLDHLRPYVVAALPNSGTHASLRHLGGVEPNEVYLNSVTAGFPIRDHLRVGPPAERGLEGERVALGDVALDFFGHQAPGVDGSRFRVERGETGRDEVGVDEVRTPAFAWEKLASERSFCPRRSGRR